MGRIFDILRDMNRSLIVLLLLGCDGNTPKTTDTSLSTESDTDTDTDSDTDTDTDTDADTDTDTDTDTSLSKMCEAAAPIVDAAQALLASLDKDQLSQIRFTLDDEERRTWSNLPVLSTPREGLSFDEMTEAQGALALALLEATLSDQGYEEALGIITIEEELQEDGDPLGGAEYYHFGIFDEPSLTEPWGWQLDGHHLAMNFTAVGCLFVMTPTLYGVSPNTVQRGDMAGFEPLSEEVALADTLAASLSKEQLKTARVPGPPGLRAGPDYEGGLKPEGLPVTDLTAAQQETLEALIESYVYDQEGVFADWKMAEIRSEYDQTYLGWIGDTTGTVDIYYRIHGPSVLIEFDHMDRSRQHIHAVYRDPENDYGDDLLAEHYQKYPH